MPKKSSVKLRWTDIQREVASKVAEGATFDKLVDGGCSKSLASKVLRAIKAGQVPPSLDSETENREPRTENREPPPKIPSKKVGEIKAGTITISIEDWSISQYGAVLILDTFERAKKEFNYSGKVGDFLCDAVGMLRRVMGFKEVEYGGDGQGDHGGQIPEGGSEEAIEKSG